MKRNDVPIIVVTVIALGLFVAILSALVMQVTQAPAAAPTPAYDTVIAEAAYTRALDEQMKEMKPAAINAALELQAIDILGIDILDTDFRDKALRESLATFILQSRELEALTPAASQQEAHAKLLEEIAFCVDGARAAETAATARDTAMMKTAYELLIPCLRMIEEWEAFQ